MPPITPRTTGQAGGFDSQFGVQIPRSTPPLMAVVLTGPFDPDTGYPWMELRLDPFGGGFVVPDLPLTGNLAYDISGNTSLQAGQRCLMAIDRNQIGYQLWVALAVPASGSGSGSGSYCDDAVPTVTLTPTGTQLSIAVPSLDIGTDSGGRPTLVTCSTATTAIGPFNSANPGGSSQVVVKSVCPVYTELCYTDCSGTPQTMQVVTALRNFRTFIVTTAGGPTGCLLSELDACCGSGSGSGNPEKCTHSAHACPHGMSTQLQLFSSPAGVDTILYYDTTQGDGNGSRFLSADLIYELVYDPELRTWVLTNLDTGFVWLAPQNVWDCTGPNGFAAVDPSDFTSFGTVPIFNCVDAGYICQDGTCYGMPEAESDYTNLGDCLAACEPLRYSCLSGVCSEDPAGEFTDPALCALICDAPVSPPVSPTSPCLAAFLTQEGLTTLPETLYIRFLSGWTTIAGTCNDMVMYAVQFNYGTGNWVSTEMVGGQARAIVGCSDDGMGTYYLSVGVLDDNGCSAGATLAVTPGYTDGGIILGTAGIDMSGNTLPLCACKGSATATVTIS